jgi:hypothetical protein
MSISMGYFDLKKKGWLDKIQPPLYSNQINKFSWSFDDAFPVTLAIRIPSLEKNFNLFKSICLGGASTPLNINFCRRVEVYNFPVKVLIVEGNFIPITKFS